MFHLLAVTFPQGLQADIINCGHNGIFAKQQHIMGRRRACGRSHQPLASVPQDEHPRHYFFYD